jgi:hypothetical protein
MLPQAATQAEERHSNLSNKNTTSLGCSRPSDDTYPAATPAAALKRRERSTTGY